MGLWILSFCIMAIETWGSIYFFDTFMERKRMGRLGKCRYVVLYSVSMAAALFGGHFDLMGTKVMLIILVFIAFCAVFYEADWKQRIFFSGLNYSLLFLTDLFFLQIENIFMLSEGITHLILSAKKMVWVCLLFVLRRIWKGKNSYSELSLKEWRKFYVVPLFTLASILLMYFCYSGEKKVQEGGKMIFSVRNPVVEKVEVVEGTGLSNVRAVAEKCDGDFAVSCDEEKFQAVVMI